MNHFSRIAASGLLVSLMACAHTDSASELVLRDVAGQEHVVVPATTETVATVLLFTATECPISNYFAPEVGRIHADYAEQGVEFLLVYADGDDLPDEIRTHVEDYSYPMPAIADPEQRLVQHTGATMTPEAVVLDPDGEVLYRGRINDIYVGYGKRRATPTQRDLRRALDAVLAGEPVAVDRTETIGCFIPEPIAKSHASGAEDSCCAE